MRNMNSKLIGFDGLLRTRILQKLCVKNNAGFYNAVLITY